MVTRGSVHWVDLATGRRPGLIMTRAAAIPLLTRVLIVPATRTVREIPSEVQLDEEDGMPATCALSFDNVVAVERSRIGDLITTLGPVKMAQVCAAWHLVADC